jgi:GNAT superfamily N-acetyltransferase
MYWPTGAFLSRQIRLPADMQLCQLGRADVPSVIATLSAWYPDLAIGEEQALLTRTFYDEEVALADEGHTIEDRPVYVLLLQSSTALVGYWAGEYEAGERAVVGRMSLVDPRYRGRGCGRAFIEAHVLVGRAIGADLAYGFAELDNHPQCTLLERTGFALCGIVPNSEIKYVALGVAKYVPEALYVKMLGSPEDLLWPRPEGLRPRTAALLKLLFDYGDPIETLEPMHTASVPELDPSITALLAVRPGGTHTWPDVTLLAPRLPAGLTLRQLARPDIPRIISVLPEWFPDIVGSSLACLMTTSFYEQSVALAGEDARLAQRPGYAFVLCADPDPVAFGYVEYRASQSMLCAQVEAVDPRYRGLGLSTVLLSLQVLLGRTISVDMIVCWATLRHPVGQRACERCGFRLVGIVPASDRVQVAPGVVKHTFEAVYAISLVPDEQTSRPASAALSPRMAAVARFILGEPQEERQ